MMRLAIVAALTLASCGPWYVGPPEYSLQCAHLPPIEALRLSTDLTPETIGAYRRAADAWASIDDDLALDVLVTTPERANVVPGEGTALRSCFAGECTEAASVSWRTGEAIITHRASTLDDYPVALHELGHALAGNPCHPSDGALMRAGGQRRTVTETDARYVMRSRLTPWRE